MLELMVTVALVSILAGIAVPSFKSVIKERQLYQAAEAIRTQVLLGQSESVRLNQNIRFFLSSTNGWCAGVTSRTITSGNDCDCAALDSGASSGQCTFSASNLTRAVKDDDFDLVNVTSTFDDNILVLQARNRGVVNLSGGSNNGHFSITPKGESTGYCVIVSRLGRVRTCPQTNGVCSSC
ncbi:GspH/FimT family pseudopilin [Gallaecimonas kandeliae]|uniref:GspH/FimT family pseudopilin n=1 Tax=Gallaecimonas kandeliae TaxID=3029055 RepID=UPI0026475CC1|nr:GspH/FimT family pseudopilin [Gallaecimonas kandeliae]WKE64952.1 GspH/FimT family pseudopilin [Gallaecimonas kandeliae]